MTTSPLAQRVFQMPALPVRVQLVARLAEDLRAAVTAATLTAADATVLETSLHLVLNGWNLSVSRFLRVQDDVEVVLTRGLVQRPLVEQVLGDLEEVFISLWNHPDSPMPGRIES
jgi:hypothetical protein